MPILKHLLAVFFFWGLSANAWSLTEQDCRDDSKALLEEIERNRNNSTEQSRQAMAANISEQERATLKEQMEESWHEEERHLATADLVLRDCLSHVEFLKKNKANE
jgi:hypothetical protein